MYGVTPAPWVLPSAAFPCPLVGARLLSLRRRRLSHHSRAKRYFISSPPYYNELPIRDRPSTLTSYSIHDHQYIPTITAGPSTKLLVMLRQVCACANVTLEANISPFTP